MKQYKRFLMVLALVVIGILAIQPAFMQTAVNRVSVRPADISGDDFWVVDYYDNDPNNSPYGEMDAHPTADNILDAGVFGPSSFQMMPGSGQGSTGNCTRLGGKVFLGTQAFDGMKLSDLDKLSFSFMIEVPASDSAPNQYSPFINIFVDRNGDGEWTTGAVDSILIFEPLYTQQVIATLPYTLNHWYTFDVIGPSANGRWHTGGVAFTGVGAGSPNVTNDLWSEIIALEVSPGVTIGDLKIENPEPGCDPIAPPPEEGTGSGLVFVLGQKNGDAYHDMVAYIDRLVLAASGDVATQMIPETTYDLTLPHVPVAVDDSATVDENGSVTTVNVLANDTDANGDTLSVTAGNPTATNGTVVNNGNGTFTYTHNGTETTTDSFEYTIADGIDGTDTGIVTITINPVNDAPVAVDDAATVAENGTVTTVNVLANDTDAENNTLIVTGNTNPVNGTVTNNNDGTFTYIHSGSETTTDSFDYTVSDGSGGTDTGTVLITITPVNDAGPVAVDDTATVAEGGTVTTVNVTANDTDADGDTLTVIGNTNPTNGTLVNNNNGTFTYTHNGTDTTTDSFDYTVSDGTSTDTGTVMITITPVADIVELVINGSFEEAGDTAAVPANWKPVRATGDKRVCGMTGTAPDGDCTFRFKPSLTERSRLNQGNTSTDAAALGEGDTLNISAMVRAKGSPKFKMVVKVFYTDGVVDKTPLTLNTATGAVYQPVTDTLEITSDVTRTKIIIQSRTTVGKIWVDQVSVSYEAE